jgi:hypothetical protein
MTSGELITRVTSELKSLSTSFIEIDFTNSLSSAIEETGYSMPTSDNTKIFWLSQRMKRHLLSSLMIENVTKFQVKQIHLEHKYKNIADLVSSMDKAWAEVQKDQTLLFLDDPYRIFGTKVDAGFQYDSIGRETTYTEDNSIIFTPDETVVT